MIIGLGAHVAFGNTVERYSSLTEGMLSGFSAIFGDVDREELGTLMWILLMYIGV